VNYRLGWGPTHSRPATPRCHAEPTYTDINGHTTSKSIGGNLEILTPPPTRPFTPRPTVEPIGFAQDPQYFTADIPDKHVKILLNDWPYSGKYMVVTLCTKLVVSYNLAVPLDVRHFVFWTRVPIIHPEIVPHKIWEKIEVDGLWGFTGSDSKPSIGPVNTSEDMKELESLVEKARFQTNEFVKANWKEDEWETAWFVNPPVR
jgi:hypothetical protein